MHKTMFWNEGAAIHTIFITILLYVSVGSSPTSPKTATDEWNVKYRRAPNNPQIAVREET